MGERRGYATGFPANRTTPALPNPSGPKPPYPRMGGPPRHGQPAQHPAPRRPLGTHRTSSSDASTATCTCPSSAPRSNGTSPRRRTPPSATTRTSPDCGTADQVPRSSGHPPAGPSRGSRCWQIHGPGLRAELPHLLKLLAGAGETHLEPFDLAEPAAFGGFAYPVVQIRDDLCEPHRLCRIWLQHRTTLAWRARLMDTAITDDRRRTAESPPRRRHPRRCDRA